MYMYTEGLQIGHIQIVTKSYSMYIGHIQIVTKSYSMYIQKYHDKSVLNKELNFHIPIKTGFGVIPLLRTIEANTKIKIKLLFQSPRIIKVYKKSITCMSTNITKKLKMINLIFFLE